jgi:acetate---CoA ligase (ADP-forming)
VKDQTALAIEPELSRAEAAMQIEASAPARRGSLDLLFKPQSIAIVGASNNPGSLSGLALSYLIRSRFAGEIWPVNPNRTKVQGVPAYASIADLPSAPDVAIIVVPFAIVQQAVEACAALGVGAVMVFTTGYGEAGEEGQAAQQKLLETVRAANMRMLGPNCLGCWNAETGFYGTFAIGLNTGFPFAGNVGVVSQSGAYGEQVAHLARKRGLGVRYFVSTGNEADIDVGEAIRWMADQPEVDVIIAYAEGTRNPKRLEAALHYAQAADKQIIFLKAGRSSVGAAAASSHTAALAGDDRIWDAVFAKYGVYRAQATEEQVDMAYAAARRIFPTDNTLGILTVSGGFGIQLCDAGARLGLDVPPLPAAIAGRLKALLPFGSINNPLDASGQVVSNLSSLQDAIKTLVLNAGYQSVVAFLGTLPLAPSMAPPLLEAMTAAAEEFRDRLVVLCLLADEEAVRAYEAAGYLVFQDTQQAARAVAGLVALGKGRKPRPIVPISLQAPLDNALGQIVEHDAKLLLAEAGVPSLPERLTRSREEAVEAATAIGFPVVMKICSPLIPHKTEIGGVLLSVLDGEAVKSGYDLLLSRAAAAGYDSAAIEGVIVAPMAPKGIETILGVSVDPTFGPAVIFGLGGIHVELFNDSTLRLAPFDEEEAHIMIREIRGWPLLEGVRGSKPADVAALALALAALSRFAAANADRLVSIDVNPFTVWEEGKGAAALDALIIFTDPDKA